jgi:hypothetical protein
VYIPGFWAKIFGNLACVERNYTSKKIYIWSDSQAALQAINNNAEAVLGMSTGNMSPHL